MGNNRLRTGGAILLIAVYCFGLAGAASGNYPDSFAQLFSPSGQNKNPGYLTDISTVLFYHFPETEKITSNTNSSSVPGPKNFNGTFHVILHENIPLFKARFRQYARHLLTLLIHSRKTDIIFPFHYFW